MSTNTSTMALSEKLDTLAETDLSEAVDRIDFMDYKKQKAYLEYSNHSHLIELKLKLVRSLKRNSNELTYSESIAKIKAEIDLFERGDNLASDIYYLDLRYANVKDKFTDERDKEVNKIKKQSKEMLEKLDKAIDYMEDVSSRNDNERYKTMLYDAMMEKIQYEARMLRKIYDVYT